MDHATNMSQDLSKIKVPPEDLVMPYVPQLVFTVILFLPLLGFIIMGVHKMIKKQSPALLFFLVGGFLCAFLEAIVDVNGMCFFPSENNIWIIYDYGRPIPLFVVLTYVWFMGGQGYVFKNALDAGRITKSGMWKSWLITMGINLVVEVPMLQTGLYIYYGPQPFKVLGFPLWWLIVNTMIPISSGFAVHKLGPHLNGWKSLLIIPIVPMADGFSNAAIAWPLWAALNSNYEFEVTYPAFFLTLGWDA